MHLMWSEIQKMLDKAEKNINQMVEKIEQSEETEEEEII